MPQSTSNSQKLIAKWTDDIKVGIYDNSSWSVRLYADRAIARIPYVKWVGNTGGYAERTERIVGKLHEKLLTIAKQQIEDDADYTEKVSMLVIYDQGRF